MLLSPTSSAAANVAMVNGAPAGKTLQNKANAVYVRKLNLRLLVRCQEAEMNAEKIYSHAKHKSQQTPCTDSNAGAPRCPLRNKKSKQKCFCWSSSPLPGRLVADSRALSRFQSFRG